MVFNPISMAVLGGSALLGGLASSSGGKGAQFTSPTAYMPAHMRQAFESTFLNAMSQPSTMPISFGGQSYSLPRQAPVQAAGMYAQAMQPMQTGAAQPSALTGALTAASGMMPWLSWPEANQTRIPYQSPPTWAYGSPPGMPTTYPTPYIKDR